MTFFEYVLDNYDKILIQTWEHLQLTLIAVALAVIIGIPIGIILMRFPKIATPCQYVLGIAQTIPSLALLGFLIPFVGIGAKPSIIALVTYSLLVIVQNTLAGINQIESPILESAKGIGMNKLQILFMVQLPLAFPVILTGIRIAMVTCVGIATLTAAVGAGGLGVSIFRGLSILDNNLIFAGAVPAALLAIILDTLLILLEKTQNKT